MREAVPLIIRSNSSVRFDTRPRRIQRMANAREASSGRLIFAISLPAEPESPQQIHIAGTRPGQARQLRTARNAVISTACVIPSESVKETEHQPSAFVRLWKTVLQGIISGTMAKRCRRCHRYERSGSVLRGMWNRLLSGPGCRTRKDETVTYSLGHGRGDHGTRILSELLTGETARKEPRGSVQ
jgi:hypothetical protein